SRMGSDSGARAHSARPFYGHRGNGGRCSLVARHHRGRHCIAVPRCVPMKRKTIALLACIVQPAAALAHTGEPIRPHDFWEAWAFDPGILIPLFLSLWLYIRG